MLDPKTIRNVAIIAHDGAGKTALTEALLRHDAPARASKDGSTSHLDVDPEESKRNFTVATHITYAEHEGTLREIGRQRQALFLQRLRFVGKEVNRVLHGDGAGRGEALQHLGAQVERTGRNAMNQEEPVLHSC